MKEQISALVDGELYEDEADNLIAKMAKDDQAQFPWETYNLIGDTLRGNSEFNARLQKRIIDKLAEEPTILAPVKRRRISENVSKIGWALAASVATFSVVTWMHQQEVATSPQIAQNAPVMIQAANDPVQSSNNLNEYLSAHEEFQPSTSGYRHTVMNTMFTGTNGQ